MTDLEMLQKMRNIVARAYTCLDAAVDYRDHPVDPISMHADRWSLAGAYSLVEPTGALEDWKTRTERKIRISELLDLGGPPEAPHAWHLVEEKPYWTKAKALAAVDRAIAKLQNA